MAAKCALKLAFDLKETASTLRVSPIIVPRLNQRRFLRNVKAVYHLRFALKEIDRFLADTSKEVA